MIFIMRLHSAPFSAIKSGTQVVETRIYDTKRKHIKVGDTIVFFKRPEEVEQLITVVTGLSVHTSFRDLFQTIDKIKLGYKNEDTIEYQLSSIRKYYSEKKEKMYGVIGIYLRVVNAM